MVTDVGFGCFRSGGIEGDSCVVSVITGVYLGITSNSMGKYRVITQKNQEIFGDIPNSVPMKDPDLSTFGDRLRYFAKTRYGTYKALCEAIDVDQSSFTGYMQNDSRPSFEVLERLHAAGLSLSWAFTGKGGMIAEDPVPLTDDPDIVEVFSKITQQMQELRERLSQQQKEPRDASGSSPTKEKARQGGK
jgi:transcriptional regulator with XRE-family HTH domain